MNKCLHITVLALGCAFLFIGLSATTETIQPRVEQVVEGHNVLIVCNTNQTADVEIFWTKDDVNSTFRQNGTYLMFVKISRRSAGEYICYSVNKTSGHETESNATVVDIVDVDVQYPAEITSFSLTPSTVLENHTFTISCTVAGNPVPTYTIKHGNRTLNSSTLVGTVTVTSWPTTCKDAGFWMCSVENRLNNYSSAFEGQNVSVLCSPKPAMSSMYYNVTARPGDEAQLTMDNEGYPFPNYTWTYNGTVLPKFMHTDFGSLTQSYSILNISSVNYTDFGNYSVTMTNDIGSYVANYQLLPTGPPLPPTNLTVSDVTSVGATLRWVSGFDMWLNQTFVVYRYISNTTFASVDFIYPNYTNHGIDDVFTYVITTFDSGTDYRVRVASEVPKYVGYTNIVIFKTKGTPHTPTKSPHINLAEILLASANKLLVYMTCFLSLVIIWT